MNKPNTQSCSNCAYKFNASMAVCPNCGQRKEGIPPVAEDEEPSDTEPVSIKPLAAAWTPEEAPGAPAIPVGCALCGRPQAAKTLEIQAWLDQGYTLTNRHKFMVTTIRPVCLCEPCGKSLQWDRVKAGAVASLPGAALAFLFPWNSRAAVAVGIAFILYALHLIKAGSYCWADRMLYGTLLEDRLRPWARAGKLQGDLRIPVGILHDLLRVGLFIVISLAGLLAGVALAVVLGE
ncbi:MAG: hypothetical protein HY291_16480 [Planctomycetes bacterium]|nr:hypothetical protein [Planctomycetota bacterium]